MDLNRWTSIGRPVEPKWPTNRAIVILALVSAAGVAVAGTALAGDPLPESSLAGLVAGAAVFLAWALARELDPDQDLSAFVGALLVLPAVLLLGAPRFASVLLALLALRIVNRTVGPPARPLDTLAVLGLAGWVAWSGDWIGCFVLFLALLLDGTVAVPHRTHLAAAGAALALTGVAASRSGFPPAVSGGSWITLFALLLLLPFLRVIGSSKQPRTLTDIGARPLDGRRVRLAQALGLLAVVLATALSGREGLAAVSPVWAALAGCGLYALASGTGRASS